MKKIPAEAFFTSPSPAAQQQQAGPPQKKKATASRWAAARTRATGTGSRARPGSLTGGNRSGLTGYRSNRSGPVPIWAGTKPAQIQNSNLNSKK